MSGRSIQKVLNPVSVFGNENLTKLGDPLGMFNPAEELPPPPKQEDPQVALRREAVNSSIRGDIIARNKQKRSSTRGAGSTFLSSMES